MVGYFFIPKHKHKLLWNWFQVLIKIVGHDLNDFQYYFLLFLFFETLLRKLSNVLDQEQSKLNNFILIKNPKIQELAKGLQVHVERAIDDLIDDGLFSHF